PEDQWKYTTANWQGGMYVNGYCLVLGDWSGGRLASKLDHKKGRQGNRQLSDHRSRRCLAGRMLVSPVASRCVWASRRDCRRHGGRRHSAFCASKNLANSHASLIIRMGRKRICFHVATLLQVFNRFFRLLEIAL